MLDNYSLRLYHEARHYTDNYRPNSDVDAPGKSYTWYAARLQIGTKTLMRVTRHACAKHLIEEKEVKRFRSQDVRYELTEVGTKIAKQLKATRTNELPENAEEDPIIKIMVRLQTNQSQEETILIIGKGKHPTSLKAVTLLREVNETAEWVITHGDTIVVTVRRDENGRKVILKGIELSPSLLERIKRLTSITLCDKDLQFTFVPHKPLPRDYLSTTKNLRTGRAKQMLKQWNCFKPAPLS